MLQHYTLSRETGLLIELRFQGDWNCRQSLPHSLFWKQDYDWNESLSFSSQNFTEKDLLKITPVRCLVARATMQCNGAETVKISEIAFPAFSVANIPSCSWYELFKLKVCDSRPCCSKEMVLLTNQPTVEGPAPPVMVAQSSGWSPKWRASGTVPFAL